ncbi:MAG TPA: hypothetical protein VGO76_19360, partial [Luteibacter sp.]|nr:hypothetical protein [Luteibacter sp.]
MQSIVHGGDAPEFLGDARQRAAHAALGEAARHAIPQVEQALFPPLQGRCQGLILVSTRIVMIIPYPWHRGEPGMDGGPGFPLDSASFK